MAWITRISPTPILLAAGMLLGLLLAMFGLLRGANEVAGLPAQAAAQVAGTSISRDELARALDAVQADRRTPLVAADKRQILGRLINEALLIQHGLDLDLVRQSPTLRDQLVDTVLTGLRAEADAKTFTTDEVQSFYRSHAALFRGPDLLQLGVIRTADKQTADAAFSALNAGNDFLSVQAEYAAGPSLLPATALPRAKIRDYLGPGLAERAAMLAVGEVTEPSVDQSGYVILQLQARQAAQQPPLSAVEDTVRHEMRRRAAEKLLQQRLQALRQRYAVSIADDLRR